MKQHTATVQALHQRQANWLKRFEAAKVIRASDIEHSSAIELFAVSGEHWSKCSSCAKAFLVGHANPAISAHARMMSSCFTEGPAFAIA